MNVPDVWGLLERARSLFLADAHANYEGMVDAQQHELLEAVDAALAQRDRWQLVPKDPGHDRLQLIFDWVMGNETADDDGHYWGTSDQVAKAKEFWAALLAAAPKSEGKP